MKEICSDCELVIYVLFPLIMKMQIGNPELYLNSTTMYIFADAPHGHYFTCMHTFK